MTVSAERPPARGVLGWTLAATCFGFALIQLDVTIVNVALPAIGRSLDAGLAGLQWIVDAYALVLAALLLSAGTLADIMGAKRVYAAGLLLFTLASLACGLAGSTGALIAARAAQGLGAAAMLPSSLALLNHACGDDGRLRGWAIGWWSSAASTAIACGPVVGGTLVGLVGWRAIFLINLPVGLLAALLLRKVADAGGATTPRRLDWPGQALAVLALAALAGAAIEAGPLGVRHPLVIVAAATALVAGAALVWWERAAPDPMLPRRLFKAPTPLLSVFGATYNVSYYGLLFVLSLYLQEVLRFDALTAGLAFIPLTATFLLVNGPSAWTAGRIGARWPMVTGAAVSAVGFLLLLRLDRSSTVLTLLPAFVLIPAGMGFAIPAMYTAVLASVDRDLSGVASALINAARQAGGVIGVAVFGAMAGDRSTVAAGLHGAAAVAALLLAGMALLSGWGLRRVGSR